MSLSEGGMALTRKLIDDLAILRCNCLDFINDTDFWYCPTHGRVSKIGNSVIFGSEHSLVYRLLLE
jgi:hypothetical protein